MALSSRSSHSDALLISCFMIISIIPFPMISGIQYFDVHCGRVNRLAHRFPHSGLFLMGFLTWSHNHRLSYTFSLLYFSHLIKSLTILFFDFKLRAEGFDIPEDPQIHLRHQSCKFITHHRPSRFSSRFSLSSWRAGFWFQFYFPFFESFCLFLVLFYKIQDFNIFSFSWLVGIQLNGLICWMVGLSGVI